MDEPAIRTVAMPRDTNPAGDIFGGWLMSQMDLAAGVVAARACPSAPEPGPADASCAAPG